MFDQSSKSSVPYHILPHIQMPACLPACLPCCSFLNLLGRIPAMTRPPSYLLLENVVGFDTSDMHALLLQCLQAAGYHVAEFILTPLQYGIPYSRPRLGVCNVTISFSKDCVLRDCNLQQMQHSYG
jgi:hypothetical protein